MPESQAQGDPAEETRSDTPPSQPGEPPAVPADGATTPPADPETPEGTPAEGVPTPEAAVQEAQRLLAGKYANKPELMKAINEAAGKFADHEEALEAFYSRGIVPELGRRGAEVGRARREAEQPGEEAEPTPAPTPDDELAEMIFSDPAQFIRTMRDAMALSMRDEVQQVARSEYTERELATQANEAVERRFFDGNPDLRGHEEHVRAAGFLLASDPEVGFSSLSSDQRATLIGEKARMLIHGDGDGPTSAQPPPISPSAQTQHRPAAPQAPQPLAERLVQSWEKGLDEQEARLDRRLNTPLKRAEE